VHPPFSGYGIRRYGSYLARTVVTSRFVAGCYGGEGLLGRGPPQEPPGWAGPKGRASGCPILAEGTRGMLRGAWAIPVDSGALFR